MMAYSEALAGKTIAISVSDSPDLGPLGMGPAHLRDAMAELARHLLALGARIAYGGDLRQGGFTEILFELVARHRRDADEGDDRNGVLSYLAWPVHMSKPFYDLDRYARELEGLATLLLLDPHGNSLAVDARRNLAEIQPSAAEWAVGLTAMRGRMNLDSDVRIIAGGQIDNYKGAEPGVAEEARFALASGTPLFVLGGFGGCAADIAATAGLDGPDGVPARDWQGRKGFDGASANLANGLTEDENRILARTPHVDEAVTLVLRGLLRLAKTQD